MNENNLINYYNKFNEEKRLKTKHGYLEFYITMTYIEKFLRNGYKICDIGAGSGAYSKYLSDLGYDVTAVELIKHNVRKIEDKGIKAIQANATNLSMLDDNTYDITLLLGPMYHLISNEELLSSLNEAKRITKENGIIFVAYCMNDFAIINHGFKEHAILSSIKEGLVDDNYNIKSRENDLYRFVRLEDINYFNEQTNLERIKIINPDGIANHLREMVNSLSEEEYKEFLKYNLSICERPELLGSGYHTLDILKKVS